jgi:hypothetical protein
MISISLLKKYAVGLALGCLTTFLVSCGGGGGSSTTSTPVVAEPGTIKGIVQDGSNNPLAGATVTAVGKTVTTGADGAFSFTTDPAATQAVVLVKKSGFSTVAKEVPVSAGTTSSSNIKVFADQVSTTFSSTTAANIAVGTAKVQIPANALKYADGTDFTGTVKIGASYYSPDTVQGVQAFAGPYIGDNAGVQSPIISMGFVEVKLTDSAGKALQLKTGSLSTLTIPASSNAGNAATIPMWFYEEARAIWVREGTATRQADGTYQATVAHFTIWNADFIGLTATLKGCFVDAAGLPIANVGAIGLRTTGWNKVLTLGVNIGEAPGAFTLARIPAGVPLELYSANSPATFTSVSIPALATGEVRTLSNCITAAQGSTGTTTVINSLTTLFVVPPLVNTGTGTGTTGTGTPPTPGSVASYANDYSGTYTGAEVGTFYVRVDSSGAISGNVFSQTFNQTFPVTGQVATGGSVALTSTGTAGSARFQGSINSTGAISGTWNYVGATGSGTFAGARVTAPTTTGRGIDAYVGTWVNCSPLGNTSSEKEVIVFTKTSATSVSWVDTTTEHNGTTCAGTGTNSTVDRGTLRTVGTKTIGTDVVDRVQIDITQSSTQTSTGLGSIDLGRTVVFINGNILRTGDYFAPFDSEGYPTALSTYIATRQ